MLSFGRLLNLFKFHSSANGLQPVGFFPVGENIILHISLLCDCDRENVFMANAVAEYLVDPFQNPV
jgi:hypothetical protein